MDQPLLGEEKQGALRRRHSSGCAIKPGQAPTSLKSRCEQVQCPGFRFGFPFLSQVAPGETLPLSCYFSLASFRRAQQSAALRALGQIAFQGVGKDANAIMAAEGVPPALKRLLLGSDTDNQRNICRILACSITGRPKHIDTLIDLDFFPRLIELHIKREVTKVMDLALFHGEEHQADYLVEKGCITALYDLLVDLGSDESETALHALRCLDLILGFGAREARDVGEVNRYAEMMIDAEGNAMLQNVYNESSNRWVRDEAQAILDAHFGAQQGCAANAAQKGDAQPGNAGLPPVYGRVDEERVLEILRQGEAYLGPCVFENLF